MPGTAQSTPPNDPHANRPGRSHSLPSRRRIGASSGTGDPAAGVRLTDPLRWSRAEFQQRLSLRARSCRARGPRGRTAGTSLAGRRIGRGPADGRGSDQQQAPWNPGSSGPTDRGWFHPGEHCCGCPSPTDAQDLSKLARLARRLDIAPPMDRRSMGSPAWSDRRRHIDNLLAAGKSTRNAGRGWTGLSSRRAGTRP